MTDPPLIAHLRTCSQDPDNELAATISGFRVVPSFTHHHDSTLMLTFDYYPGRSTAGLGIRPRVLAHNEDGSKIYGLNGKQVAKLLATYDAALAA